MSGRTLRRRFYPVGSSDCKLYLPFYAYGGNQQKIWDISGNNNHATITGAVPVAIYPNIGWYCDGTDDGFTITDFLETGNSGKELSPLIWIYPHAFINDTGIFAHWSYSGNNRAWRIHFSGTEGKFGVEIRDDGTQTAGHKKTYVSDVAMKASKFNLLGFTFNAGTLSLFLNGVEVATTKTADDAITTIFNCPHVMTIGAMWLGVLGNLSNITVSEAISYNNVQSPLNIRNYFQITRRRYGV